VEAAPDAVTGPRAGSSHGPTYLASTNWTRSAHGVMHEGARLTEVEEHRPGRVEQAEDRSELSSVTEVELSNIGDSVVVATTTAGTTMADLADRLLGIGYPGGSSLLFALLMVSLLIWYRSEESISVSTVSSPLVEAFWVAIPFSQTLGTALGDWMANITASVT
jgi:hypothetical protein